MLHISTKSVVAFRYINDQYAPPTSEPIKWWIERKGTYPTLWRMAVDMLGIPATSTPSERLFSKAGEIYSNRRKRLNADAAQALLNIASWWGQDSFPGANAPVLDHPHIAHMRRKYLNMPLAKATESGGWQLETEKGQEINLIEEELEENPIYKELKRAAIHEDELADDWIDIE